MHTREASRRREGMLSLCEEIVRRLQCLMGLLGATVLCHSGYESGLLGVRPGELAGTWR
jgi:hypothetical protein